MQALGFIETKGFVAAVEAADSAMKAASVSLVGQKWVGGGLVTVVLTGDVAAVKSAVDAGTESASAVGEVVGAQVIASPHAGMDRILKEDPVVKSGKIVAKSAPTPKKESKQTPPQKKPGV